ncbi:unnamed protein product [Brachionus calyciflorus]|uniref:Uncharacterized protein n=1 Tax=Brachionus calyciflorus TaxID=104777 RepID=A0A813UJG6_9BILA|nr:unnamed protein product [Brachionus calyciflorus]
MTNVTLFERSISKLTLMTAEEVFNTWGNTSINSQQQLEEISEVSTRSNEKLKSSQFNTIIKGKFTVINGNTLVRTAYDWNKK